MEVSSYPVSLHELNAAYTTRGLLVGGAGYFVYIWAKWASLGLTAITCRRTLGAMAYCCIVNLAEGPGR